MKLYFGQSPDDHKEIDDNVKDWEAAICIMGMAILVAAEGPEGFDEDELDAVMVGAKPNEVVKMSLQAINKLVTRAWPELNWE